ncbi:hypothetical protein L226DRAFT_576945 [Lentinus tigrinus ALCF2SS1-7]|uniref:Uncharacterized protein n=1 Tax=Lentinus tigrinus ALCF2SS1-6 TaxID=1328759 RepID=A0A5C2S359_9APHY|nr:hypothetical protein L227DRAFT_613286 [Lentinus tigrinus ALCF2SS1-6]RPD67768.1 hypothetical protein L226DRAFT_576973 [Lentinus tigrinus ALCF2SS1-7]RPD67795.1 hypothetical protein L226DRAFT_576945 [Lentinus tigrinus ALCF2SS1-7]
MARRKGPHYNFHASVEKTEAGPTFLDFASPAPPYCVRPRLPTILREFGKMSSALPVKAEPAENAPLWTRPRSPRAPSSAKSATTLSSVNMAARNISSRTPTPAASWVTTPAPSVGSVTLDPSYRPPPSVSCPGTPVLSKFEPMDVDPESESEQSRDTARSSTRIAHRKAQQKTALSQTAPSVPTPELALCLPSLDPYLYDSSDFPHAQTQEEKAAERKGKGKSKSAQEDNVWWHVKVGKGQPLPISQQALRYPPDLTPHPTLHVGDLFYHHSMRGIQLWQWSETPNTLGEWRPVLLGIKRDVDDRLLGLTPGLKPSWVTKGHYRRMKTTVPVFILPQ